MENEKTEENISLQMNPDSFQSYKASSKTGLIDTAKHIVTMLPKGGVIFVRDNVNDYVCSFLKKNNIMVVRRVPESTLRSLSRVSDSPIFQTPEEVEFAAPVTLKRERHSDVWYLFVSGEMESSVATLILRGATTHTLDEVERGFDDALGVVSLVRNTNEYVIGGGNSYARMSAHLRQHAAKIGGRAQMAIEAFSDALEIIPATIAENAGHDPLDVVLAMRHEILQGNVEIGPDVDNGGVCNMLEKGVIEPTSLVRQAVQSASEVTNSVLRIDDIIARRPSQ